MISDKIHIYKHFIIVILVYMCADLSVGTELLKACLKCVSKIKSILLVILNALDGATCISIPISHMMVVRICVLYFIIVIKLEVLSICHCLG